MSVVFSRAARDDLVEIGLWIEEHNPARADSFIAELESACAGLGSRPSRFPVAATVRGEVIRKRVHRGYLIFYRVRDRTTEIVRVVNGRRDWVEILQG